MSRLGATDEAYLLLESAVGVVAPMQVVVEFDVDPGARVASDLVARLAGGPLDRAVRRPAVPGARPSWVRPPGLAVARVDVEFAVDPDRWAQRHMTDAPVDVVGARGWEVATAATRAGGRVVSIVASHVLADGRRFVGTVADAVAALDADPAPARKAAVQHTGPIRRLTDDAADAVAAVADAGRAVARLVAARGAGTPTTGARRDTHSRSDHGDDGTPTHHVVTLDRDRWHDVARSHGGTATTLLAAVGAGLARSSGVVAARGGPDAPLRLTLTVDHRAEGDTDTANTAGGVAVSVPDGTDPTTGLTALRGSVRAALSDPPADDAIARVARLLPSSALARVVAGIPGPDVSVSHLGAAPDGLLEWRGVRPDRVVVRAAARSADPDLARRMLPGVAVWAVEHDDAITVAVCAADPVARSGLADLVDDEVRRWSLAVAVRRG